MRLKILFFLLPVIYLSTKADAQTNLGMEITVGRIDHQRLGTVLQNISSKGQFTFAYNNRTVPADSLISMDEFRGTIRFFLSRALGMDYEFKEVPGYIVLRHAPDKMILTAVLDEVKDQQFTIKGSVLNASNKQPLKQVSIYEENQLISTMTDERGEFELTLKNQTHSILLTATKESFRDTNLHFLQEVKVNAKKKRSYRYYPDETVNKLGKSFAGLFISSKQRIQSMNLGGFFAFSPYQVSLTPGLSSHGMYSSQVVDHVSVNLLGGYTAGVQGVELAGLFNVDRWDVTFLQAAGLFNVVGGNMGGVQFAGLYNQVLNKTTGIQVAGIANSTDEVNGMQIAGLVNVAKKGKGVQVAGIANSTDEVNGMQVAGLVNVAKKVKGVQIAGLVNIADSSDYPVALINFIRNGRKDLSLSFDALQYMHIDFRSGGRVLYGLIGTGYAFNHPGKYAFNIGFGAHLIDKHLFTFDAEYAFEALTDFKKDPDQIRSLRLLAGLKLSKRIELFAGPDINLASYPVNDPLELHGWTVHKYVSGNNVNNIYASITGGLRFTW